MLNYTADETRKSGKHSEESLSQQQQLLDARRQLSEEREHLPTYVLAVTDAYEADFFWCAQFPNDHCPVGYRHRS